MTDNSPMRICVLASGSSGNCTYVEGADGALLLDAGLSAKETIRRLELIGARLDRVQGICISHEHSDHTAGLSVLHRRYGIPIYANSGTIEGLTDDKIRVLPWRIFVTGSFFSAGGFSVEPFSVPHDAYEPVGFVVKNELTQVGIVTDMGTSTTLIRERLRPCRALVVEANHDERLLQDAQRPWHLKQRILGRQGHLSNEHAAQLVAEIASLSLQRVFLAHISEECNRRDLALKTMQTTLQKAGHHHLQVSLTYADQVSEIWDSDSKPANAG
jgi:phosphoribosyl 1,2-cyclic phosphodiesterase